VGAEHVVNTIMAIVNIFRGGKCGVHLKILIYIPIIYYIKEVKHPEISIFRHTAVTNIRKYQTCVIHDCRVGQWE
jgi:hypothetical protein